MERIGRIITQAQGTLFIDRVVALQSIGTTIPPTTIKATVRCFPSMDPDMTFQIVAAYKRLEATVTCIDPLGCMCDLMRAQVILSTKHFGAAFIWTSEITFGCRPPR
jgi:hypothetical protein